MIQKNYQIAKKYAGELHRDQRGWGTQANYLLLLSNVAMEIIMT
ncbi:MAG: hypothetical protein ACJA1A_003634 [Saprospiraceae bacterium]|jgi:hypothetical protein|tara:strand:+ start:422 stop:553 length:132 start_codon:yes stop_codon:yes gene_type:complete